jgi:hypothetical protein
MDLLGIINNIKERIDSNGDGVKNLIYMGIGTYAGYKEPDGSLLDKNYHQYPPFIQHLKNSIDGLNLYIILIDPLQENPPYMIADKGLSNDKSINIYTLRENVYTEPYEEYGIDITSHLRDINKYVIENNITFIYNDFSGRENKLLAEYFDDDICEHLDHIIYGLGLREYFGCYLDLTDKCSYHPYYIDENGFIKLFNIYYYIVNERLDMIDRFTHNDNDNDILNKHINKVSQLIKYELTSVMLQSLRVAFRLRYGQPISEYDSETQKFHFLSGNKKTICLSLLNDKNYDILYEYLMNEFGKKINVFSNLKNLDISGREILNFITNDIDPFKWYNNVKDFFK